MSYEHSITTIDADQASNSAKQLGSLARQKIGSAAFLKISSISDLARENNVSRKFVYAQKEKIQDALSEAFGKSDRNEEVLFTIPVTRSWLKQAALELILVCHSSYQGVVEFFRDIIDWRTSKGDVHNVVHEAMRTAETINASQDLSQIRVGAHDELYQGMTPVLAGCDVHSTYCYLLRLEDRRDTETWAIRLMELSDRGLKLEYSIADAGTGLRGGQREAWPEVPCHGDIFHSFQEFTDLTSFVENRSMEAIEAETKLEQKVSGRRIRKVNGIRPHRNQVTQLYVEAKRKASAWIKLYDDLHTLQGWLQNDILSVVGPDLAGRIELFDFVVTELEEREPLLAHRISLVRRRLKAQRDDLLKFVELQDRKLDRLAVEMAVDPKLIRALFELQALSENTSGYWPKMGELQARLSTGFYSVNQQVTSIIAETVRASSVIENLNSRLRNYFFLRKSLDAGYLELLRFFFNHRRFMRSSRPERIGKSPKELLTSQTHEHWLELLGYTPFKRQATELDIGGHPLPRAA